MAAMAEISVQPTNDPNVKAYHTRFSLSDGPEVGTRGCSDDVGAFGNLILEIRGIAQVHVGPYVLLVTKAPLFEWAEIDPSIQEILKTFAISQKQIEDAHANPAPPIVDRVPGRRPLSPRAIREGREAG